MEKLIKKILRESIEDSLTRLEIGALNSLASAGLTDKSSIRSILDFLTSTLELEYDQAVQLYELFLANYRPDGDYENIGVPYRIKPEDKKSVKTANVRGRDLVMAKRTFKGSNTSGEYINGVYVVKSYGWYPIFVNKQGKWYENSERYSISTSKQMSQLRPMGVEITKLGTSELRNLYNG